MIGIVVLAFADSRITITKLNSCKAGGIGTPLARLHRGALQRSGCHNAPNVMIDGELSEMRWLSLLVIWGMLGVSLAIAQAAGEHAGAVSSMGSVGVGAATAKQDVPDKLPTLPPAKTSDKPNRAPAKRTSEFKHLPASNGEPVEVKNRRELEQKAGKEAAKLLLRSGPTNASIWINGKRIGDTPLLLLLAPDRYLIELRGSRLEFAQQRVSLLPNETREVMMTLRQRYPSQVNLR